jgi:Glycosyl transferase family 2
MSLLLLSLCVAAFLFALIPCVVYQRNLRVYRPLVALPADRPAVSVLIPARNESRSIVDAVESALESTGVEVEVIVLDDHSEDDTRAKVEAIATRDPRVRVESAPELPEGWCGKQHACFALSKLAKHDLMVFMDADVRLATTGLARMVAFAESSGADLISGIPKQITGTLSETLAIPLIHFLLLGFLPMWRMRQSTDPSFGAGCGQLFLAKRSGYDACGGHSAIKESMHDGVKLPRAFRAAGRKTDLFDATDVAVCRMYWSASQVWFGLAKNAREGLAAPRLIVPVTVLLLAGQVFPFAILACAGELVPIYWIIAACTVVLVWGVRFDAAVRFRQSWLGAILHPVAILHLLAIQWFATFRHLLGRPSGWKGRSYGGTPSRLENRP